MDIPLRDGWLTATPEFKPGDPSPSGYLDWHEWADVQSKAGLKQVRCGICSLWSFPQELGARTVESRLTDSRGRETVHVSPVCLKCEQKQGAEKP